MGWFIVAALVVALALLVWRGDRRMRRSGSDRGTIGPAEMSTRVWANMRGGKRVKYRRP